MKRRFGTALTAITTTGAGLRPLQTLALPSSRAERTSLHRLAPLWRHGVWFVAVCALLAIWVDIRVEVQQLRDDLERVRRVHREATLDNERLRLEWDARRRLDAVEHMGVALSLAPAEVQTLTVQTPTVQTLTVQTLTVQTLTVQTLTVQTPTVQTPTVRSGTALTGTELAATERPERSEATPPILAASNGGAR